MPQGGAPVTPVDRQGNVIGAQGSTAAAPSYEQSVGSPNIATSQATSSVSPAAATQVVAARAGRRAVTFTNITGTQPVYFGPSGVTVSTGFFLAGTAGATLTIPTGAAVSATSPTAAQTIGVLEVY